MSIKRRSKIDSSMNMSSMSDLVFLLLIFFMITSTLVAPNALKLLLPESNNQTQAKPITSVSITEDLRYYINDNGKLVQVNFQDIEPFLKRTTHPDEETYIALHADKSVPIEEVVKVMNIAQKNKFKLILATSPEQNSTTSSGLFK